MRYTKISVSTLGTGWKTKKSSMTPIMTSGRQNVTSFDFPKVEEEKKNQRPLLQNKIKSLLSKSGLKSSFRTKEMPKKFSLWENQNVSDFVFLMS